MLVERTSPKKVLLWALALQAAGALLFPSYPLYVSALASFFLIGIGAAALQVVVNPLLRVAGGEEHFAFNSALAQFIFGAGSFLGPLLYSYLVLNLGRESPAPLWLRALGCSHSACSPLGFGVLGFRGWQSSPCWRLPRRSACPRIVQTEEESAGSWDSHLRLFRMPVVWLYFITIFLYVGLEQGLANWMSQFLFTYHNVDPRTTGALAVSWFWGTMTLACLVGLVLLKLFDGRRLLIWMSPRPP